jgi:hypothetical protein
MLAMFGGDDFLAGRRKEERDFDLFRLTRWEKGVTEPLQLVRVGVLLPAPRCLAAAPCGIAFELAGLSKSSPP